MSYTGLYRIPVYSGFSLDRFCCIKKTVSYIKILNLTFYYAQYSFKVRLYFSRVWMNTLFGMCNFTKNWSINKYIWTTFKKKWKKYIAKIVIIVRNYVNRYLN